MPKEGTSVIQNNQDKKEKSPLIFPRIMRISWRNFLTSLVPVLLATVVAVAVAMLFIHPAPPSTITISSGPEGSIFRTIAEKYRANLARNGIKAVILPSEGSLDNFRRLLNPQVKVDVGLVQGGVANGNDIGDLVSLGSMAYEPLAIFYSSALE